MAHRSVPAIAAIALTLPLLAVTVPAAANPSAKPRCAGHAATIVGTKAADRLKGTKHRDVIVGRGGDDVIRGLGKDDVICGRAGDDVLVGGGDRKRRIEWQWFYYGDTLVGGTGDDRIWGDAKSSRAPGTDSVRYTAAPRRVTVKLRRRGKTTAGVARGHGHDRLHTIGEVHGSRHADKMSSGKTRDTSLYGGRGRDRLSGRNLHGERGRDRLVVRSGGATGGRGNDSITATGTDLALGGGPGADRIRSDGDETEFTGGPGADRLVAARGHNGFDLGRGADSVLGGTGPDLVYDAGKSDSVRLRRGSDTVYVSRVPRRVFGGPGADDLIASDIGRADPPTNANRLIIDLRDGQLRQTGTRADVAGFERVTGAESVPNSIVGTGAPERLVGGCYADALRGRGGADRTFPLAGDDVVHTGTGDDTINETESFAECADRSDDDRLAGGAGDDLLRLDRWGSSPAPVLVDLSAGTSNSSGDDTLSGLENVRGGNHDAETIVGDEIANRLDGGQSEGDDVRGLGGNDVLRARGATGRADGGEGTDTCHAATTVNCEN